MSEEKLQADEVAVLFSGGRDSSLVTCLLAQAGARLHLISTNNGAVIKPDIANYRYDELQSTFPNNIVRRIIIPSYSLFRRIALADIEKDFDKYKKNLIPVGDGLASHVEAIIYCLKNRIRGIASGFTKYESHYPEQLVEAVSVFRLFINEYSINYLTPVFEYDNVNKVKYRLFDFGISTKSLEGTSLFANTYSSPSPEVVVQYISDKLAICREYIDFKLGRNQLDPLKEEEPDE